jgi:hypothetical protein
MPGVSRCDLTNACAFYHSHCTRGYRAHRTPGIPCALLRAEGFLQSFGRTAPRALYATRVWKPSLRAHLGPGCLKREGSMWCQSASRRDRRPPYLPRPGQNRQRRRLVPWLRQGTAQQHPEIQPSVVNHSWTVNVKWKGNLLPVDRGGISLTMQLEMPVGAKHRRRTTNGRATQPPARALASR